MRKSVINLAAAAAFTLLPMQVAFAHGPGGPGGPGGDDGAFWGAVAGTAVLGALAVAASPPPQPPVMVAPQPVYVVSPPAASCQQFPRQVMWNGIIQQSYGTACLGPDGQWHWVN